MNYQKSQQILDEVKKAKRILLNCHYGADPDGIGSTLALKLVLEKLGKKVVHTDLFESTRGYGAAHCMTGRLRRSEI